MNQVPVVTDRALPNSTVVVSAAVLTARSPVNVAAFSRVYEIVFLFMHGQDLVLGKRHFNSKR